DHEKTKIKIKGRIGRVVGCLPLQSDTLMTTNQLSSKDNKDSRNMLEAAYFNSWKQMEIREFIMQETNCDDSEELHIDQYT
ncbi:unnamed protein product, partial [Rotaria magnacalcarata]